MERLLCVVKQWLGVDREAEQPRAPTHEEILAAVRRRLELAGVSFDAEGKIVTE